MKITIEDLKSKNAPQNIIKEWEVDKSKSRINWSSVKEIKIMNNNQRQTAEWIKDKFNLNYIII